MKKFLFLLCAVSILQACSSNEVDKGIKSPCVSAEIIDIRSNEVVSTNAPCGPRRSANAHWLG